MIPAPISLERLAIERVRDRRHEADDWRRLRTAEPAVTSARSVRFPWLAPWRRQLARAEQAAAREDSGDRPCVGCPGLAPGGAH